MYLISIPMYGIYVYIYTRIYTHTYIRIHHIYTHTHVYTYGIYVWYIRIYVCVQIMVYTYIYTRVYVCMHVCMLCKQVWIHNGKETKKKDTQMQITLFQKQSVANKTNRLVPSLSLRKPLFFKPM